MAGSGVRGGTVVGTSDKIGGFPHTDPQTPENMAATIYEALGPPRTIAWKDRGGRPHQGYGGDPIAGVTWGGGDPGGGIRDGAGEVRGMYDEGGGGSGVAF